MSLVAPLLSVASGAACSPSDSSTTATTNPCDGSLAPGDCGVCWPPSDNYCGGYTWSCTPYGGWERLHCDPPPPDAAVDTLAAGDALDAQEEGDGAEGADAQADQDGADAGDGEPGADGDAGCDYANPPGDCGVCWPPYDNHCGGYTWACTEMNGWELVHCDPPNPAEDGGG